MKKIKIRFLDFDGIQTKLVLPETDFESADTMYGFFEAAITDWSKSSKSVHVVNKGFRFYMEDITVTIQLVGS